MSFPSVSRKIFACVVVLATSVCMAASAVDTARTMFADGRYTEAKSTLAAEEANGSQDADVYYWLGRCDFELREFDAAIGEFEHAISLRGNVSEYHHWLGRSYGRKAEHSNWFSGVGLAKKTHAEFERAVDLDPRDFPAQRDLVTFQLRAPGFLGGGEDRAQAQITKIAALDPVQGHLAQKDLYVEYKEWSRADQECQAALAANPKDPDDYADVADYYDHRGNGAAVRATLAAAARNGVSSLQFDYYVGVAAVLVGDHYDEGETALRRYLADVPQRSAQPSHADAHVWLGHLYDKQGKHDPAVDEYREALKSDPGNKAAREALKHGGE